MLAYHPPGRQSPVRPHYHPYHGHCRALAAHRCSQRSGKTPRPLRSPFASISNFFTSASIFSCMTASGGSGLAGKGNAASDCTAHRVDGTIEGLGQWGGSD